MFEEEIENDENVNILNVTPFDNNTFTTPSRPRPRPTPSPTPSPNDNRQKHLGEKIMRRNRYEKSKEIDDLKKKHEESAKQVQEKDIMLMELQAEKEQIERKHENIQNKLHNNDVFIKASYKNLASDGKRQYRESVIVSAEE